jgi:outer membrane protein assembly factor BamA
MRLLERLVGALAVLIVCSGTWAAGPAGDLTVERFSCVGNKATSCDFILGYLYLSVGDPVDEQEIQNAKLRLQGLRNFSSVDIYLRKGAQRGSAIVVVDVHEANPVATAFTAATESRVASVGQVFSGHLTDYNLLGAGQILDAQLETRVPLRGPAQRDVYAALQYVEPHLFNSKRYYLTSSLAYFDGHYELKNGDLYTERMLAGDVSLGRRIWGFGYIAAGVQLRPVEAVSCRYHSGYGGFTSASDTAFAAPEVSFGWNTEDSDFPTGGSRLDITFTRTSVYMASGSAAGCGDATYFFRKTWRVGAHDYLSLWFQQVNDFGLTYAHDLSISSTEIRRARWYVEPGDRWLGHRADGDSIRELGIRAGVRFDTRRFGQVDLYLYGSTDWFTRQAQ